VPFFTRPHLDNTQFQQLSGETLTLSGITNFSGVLKSKGVEIDASLTGATSALTGTVLTFIGNKIRLAPSNNSNTDSLFNSSRATTRSGIPAVNVGGTTVKQFLEGYFFPSVPPTVAISGGVTRLFGNNSGFTINWTVTRRTLPITSITVKGLAVPSGFYTALAQNGSLSSGTTATISIANNNQNYPILTTTASESVSAITSMVFSHKKYFYGDNQDLIAFNDVNTSTNLNLNDTSGKSEFSSTRVKSTFSINLTNQFLYYIYPTSFGASSFTINGLLNTDFSFKDFTFTNQYGYVATFRMYRSNNILNGTFNVAVS
jgi:hypothetical protein